MWQRNVIASQPIRNRSVIKMMGSVPPSINSEVTVRSRKMVLRNDHFPHLNDLLTTGPVERGIYVAPVGSNLVPQIQEGLINLLWHYSQNISAESLSQENRWSDQYFSRRVSQIGQIHWIDTGHSFDSDFMDVLARRRGLEPARILRAIKVGAPLTTSEYQEMLERVPNPALLACPEPESALQENFPSLFSRTSWNLGDVGDFRAPSAVWWTPLVVISDLMRPFYDSKLSEEELQYAFREFLVRLSHLRNRAIVLAILNEAEIPMEKRHLLPEVLRLCRRARS